MDDLVTYALLTASAVFVVLSVVLLARYRQVSQRISASSDLGRDLWEALEARLKKQDERILDVMARMEVIQSRAVKERTEQAMGAPGVLGLPPLTQEEPRETPQVTEPARPEGSREVTSQPPAPRPAPVTTPAPPAESELAKALEAKLGQWLEW